MIFYTKKVKSLHIEGPYVKEMVLTSVLYMEGTVLCRGKFESLSTSGTARHRLASD